MTSDLTPLRVQPDETANDLFRRKSRKPFELGLPASVLPHRPGRGTDGYYQGDVIEIYGNSGAGKTELLIYTVVNTIIPSLDDPETQRKVYYFDNDCRLDLDRLEQVLKFRIINLNSQLQDGLVLSDTDIDTVLSKAMSRVFVIRCATTLEFAAAIELVGCEVHNGEAMIVLDSIGSFYYSQKITEGAAGEGAAFTNQPVRSLTKLVKEKNVMIVAAKPLLFKSRGGVECEHREYMSSYWQQLVTTRINLICKCNYGTMDRGSNQNGYVIFQMVASKGTGEVGTKEHFIVSDEGLSLLPSDLSYFQCLW